MITSKPKQFHIVCECGGHVGFRDPITKLPWYRLSWPTIKSSMTEIAAKRDMPITIVNDRCGNSLTVTPEGEWQ